MTTNDSDDDIVHYGHGSTGVSGAGGFFEQARKARCPWCDRVLDVRWSAREALHIFPRHDRGRCAGSGAAVPPGAFVRQSS